MRVMAFVGASGTGKSYRSITVSQKYKAEAIIDDGLLISQGKVLAGSSAKREPTRLASVRHALFMKSEQCSEIKKAISKYEINSIMILGTSEGMVDKIAVNIGLPPVEKYIYITEEATEEEMAAAKKIRSEEGKHIIPVPTFEIKQDFSGYFLHPLRHFQKVLDNGQTENSDEKSIVRPTFSYMGDYSISNNVIIAIAMHEAKRVRAVTQIHNMNLRTTKHGVHIDMTVTLEYTDDIRRICRKIQHIIRRSVEEYTSVNVRRVNILVKRIGTAS